MASFDVNTMMIWRTQVRFIGAGTIGVSAIFTLATLAKPVVGGLSLHAAGIAGRGNGRRTRSRYLATWIIGLAAVCLASPAGLRGSFASAHHSRAACGAADASRCAFRVLVGFLIAGVAGYMAGLIGASNSPISGIGILGIVTCAVDRGCGGPADAGERGSCSSRLRCSSPSIVFACATISNDNLQDLKTGQLVGASPMKQQIALIVGVAAGAAVIPSVLNLLAKAYGFAGAAERRRGCRKTRCRRRRRR